MVNPIRSIIVSLAAGITITSEVNFAIADLRVGMTPYDVVKNVGPALDKSSNTVRNEERWSYKEQVVTFVHGKITSISTTDARVNYQPEEKAVISKENGMLNLHSRFSKKESPRLTEKTIRDIFSQVSLEEGKDGDAVPGALPSNPLIPQPPNISIPGMPRVPMEE